MSERELIPISPIGEELNTRFQQFTFRTNPNEAPMARALLSEGYEVTSYPLQPTYTTTDWLASKVLMDEINISFRQPTPHEVWICFIERKSTARSMKSALLGIVDFFSFCRDYCPEVEYVGGNIDKLFDHPTELKMDQLIGFYNRFLGCVECYQKSNMLSIYAKLHLQERFETFPIWKWRKKRRLKLKA